ncbi:hypothetical protein HDV00_005446 [Rhizophlyctis rosea]|nr:hypothetical protein HDV00_005446 [Rhizophlyctis rosea]
MNHAAGFVQLSVAKFENSDKMDEYNQNIFHFNCHEQGCMSGEACPELTGTSICNEPFGGDNEIRPSTCSQSFTVPTWLPDGQYTILWTWFGSGGYGGDKYAGQSDYSQCMDFTVKGGADYKPKPSNFCPTFKGGDIHTNGNKNQCFYHGNGNRPGQCVNAPCSGSYKGGMPGQFEGCLKNGGGSGGGGFSSAPSATTKKPSTTTKKASTTKAPAKTTAASVVTKTSFTTKNGKVYKIVKIVHVKPVMAKKKADWETCDSPDECQGGCCDGQWSGGVKKCYSNCH